MAGGAGEGPGRSTQPGTLPSLTVRPGTGWCCRALQQGVKAVLPKGPR